MAQTFSFDVTSNIEMPEVDNAVNQARKEIGQRFDFKGSIAQIDLDQKANTLTLTAEDNFKLESVWDVLQTRLIKRSVPVKNMKRGEIIPSAGSSVKQVITLQQGIPIEAAKEIVKHLKDLKKGVEVKTGTATAPGEVDVSVGSGQLDMAAVLRAAKQGGSKLYYLEDESPDPWGHIPESVKYLANA